MYATGGLKKFFRLMAMLLVLASIVGLLPISAFAEGLKGEDEPEDTSRNTETTTPEVNEDTRAGETTTSLLDENFDNSFSSSLTSNSYSASGWYSYTNVTNYNWTLSSSSSYAHSGSYSMQYTYSGSSAADCYLVSPPLSVSAGMTSLNVGVYEYVRRWSSSTSEKFEVYFIKASDVSASNTVDNATKYAAIATATYTNTSYAQVTGSCTNSALKGQSVRLVIHCNSEADQYYLHIDDVTVSQTAQDATTYTLNFNVNGSDVGTLQQTGLLDGDSVTLPTPTVDFSNTDEKYFIGWVTQSYATATPISGINPVYYVNSNSAYYTTPYTVDANNANSSNEITLFALFGNWDGTSTTTLGTPTTVVTYELVSAPVAGEQYIITSGSYAVSNNAYNTASNAAKPYLAAVSITDNGDNTISVPSGTTENTLLWTAGGDATNGWTFLGASNSLYIGLNSGEYLCPSSTAVAWLQQNVTSSGCDLNNQIDSEGYYYLAIGSSNAYFTTSQNTNGLIKFYHRVETTTGGYTVPAYTNCTTVLHTTPTATYTVNYYVNGSLLSSQSNVSSASLPTAAQATNGINFDDYEEDAFVVWVPQTYAKGTLQNLNGVTYYEAGASLDAATLAGLADANNVINLYALFAEENEGGGSTGGVKYRPVTSLTSGKRYVIFDGSQNFGAFHANSTGSTSTIGLDGNKYSFYSDSTGYYITVDESAEQAYVWSYNGTYMYTTLTGYTTNGLYYTTSSPYYIRVQSSPDVVTKTTTSQSYTYGTGYRTYLGSSYNYYLLYSSTYDCIVGSTTASQGDYIVFYEQTSETAPAAPAYKDNTYTTTLTPLAPMHNLTVNFVYAAGGTAAPTVTQQVREGDPYTVEVPAITGYTPSPATVTGTMGQADVTVTVTYTPNQHTIHYSAAYPTTGSYTNDVTADYGDTLTIPSDVPAITGYTLSWTWRTGSATGAVYSGTTMPDEDVWAIGVYRPNEHTVTFMVEGVQYAQETAVFGSQLPPAGVADPTREGYVFTGWVYSGNGSEYTGSTMPDYDLTATATWRAAATAVSLVIDPTYVEIGGTAVATATVTAGNGAVLGTDYFITWAIIDGSDCAEFVGTTANLTQVTLRGIAQGVATVQVTVTNGRDNPMTATATLAVGRYITGIAVTYLPDQVAYTTGSTLDTTGMVVQYVYNDGTYGDVLTASQYTVTAPNMNTANEHAVVTVTAVENSSWTDSFQIDVHTASGTTEVWAPVNTIDTSKDYLIGFVAGNTVYLALCYSPTQSAYYYQDSSSYVNYGYTGIATMDGVNVIGVSGNATSLDYAQWNFSSSSGGTISSVYGIGNSTDGYKTQYLNTWSSTSYADLYPTTSNSQATNWIYRYDSTTGQAVLYRTISSTNRYAQYYTDGSRKLMCVSSTANSTSYVQLYSKQTLTTNHTIVFYAPDGKTVVYTVTVDDGDYITAAQLTAAQTAAMQGQTGNFNGWDYYGGLGTGTFSNAQIAAYPVNEDCYFVANVGNPRWTVEFYDEDGTTLIGTASVEQGQPLTAADLANIVAPTKLGYEFVGWSDGTNTYTMAQLEGHTPAANETYTAVYEAVDYTLTIHFVDGDNVGLTLPQDVELTYGYGDAYFYNQYPAYIELNGVPYDAEPQAVQGTMPASDLTVDVTYSIRVVEISLVYNGQTYTQQIEYNGSPSQAAFEAACTLPLHFDAASSYWSETAGGASYISYLLLFGETFTDDATFYLNVGLTPCVATFYTVQSGELDNDGRLTYTMQTQETVEYGTKPTQEPTVADVVVNGSTYTFVGWIISYDNATYDTAHVYSFADLPALTADTYYRAVYYNTDQTATTRRYVLVEEPVDGMDYIIVDVGEAMAVTDENVTNNHYLVPVAVTLDYSEGGVEDYYCYVGSNITDDQIFWHFEQDGNNWIIKSSNDKYMTVTPSSDGSYLTALASDSRNARWSYDSDNHKLEIVSPSGLTQKYLTYVGGGSSKLAQFIGLNDAEIVMNAIQAAQNNGAKAEQPAEEIRATTDKYELVSGSNLTAGEKYLIVYASGNYKYVVTTDEYSSTYGIVQVARTTTTQGSDGYYTFSSDMAANQYTANYSSTYSGWSFYNATEDCYFGMYYYSSSYYPAMMSNTSEQFWTINSSGRMSMSLNQITTNGSSTSYRYLQYNSSTTYGTYGAVTATNYSSSASNFTFYRLVTPYNITVTQPTGGTVSVSVAGGTATTSSTTATAGQTVTLTATANSGYTFGSWNVSGVTGTANGSTYTFTMPSGNVTVTATFTASSTPGGNRTFAPFTASSLDTSKAYLIGYLDGTTLYLMSAADSTNSVNPTYYRGYVTVTGYTSGNNVTISDNALAWHFSSTSGGNITNESRTGYYLVNTTSSSDYALMFNGTASGTWTVTKGSGYAYTIRLSTTKYIEYYTSTNGTIFDVDASSEKSNLFLFQEVPSATTYTVTVQQPTGGTITATPTTATAGTTINLTATPASGYTFGSWTVTDTTNNTTVTVTNNSFTMPAGNVTVTATFTSGSTPVGSVYYEPTSTIVAGEEYLIGYKDGNGNVYLMMNYNPSPIGSNNRYYSLSANYYAYGVQAVMSGDNVVGIVNTYSGATINNAEWIFENAETGYYRIQSARTADNGQYYLIIYNGTGYSDLYASASNVDYYGHQWAWDPANNRLSFYYNYNGTSFTKYVAYAPTVGNYSNFFHAPTTPSSVQLYRKRTGTVDDYRFTLNAGTTAQPAGEIKLYGLAEDTHTPEVSVTPNNQVLYWYDENVVWYDDTAEIIQEAVLVGAFANIDPATAVVTWSTSDDSIVSIDPNGNECTVTAEGVGVAVVTYSVTDIFGNVYTAQAQIIVQQAPIGEIPEEDETWYTGGPEYKVYIETDHFEAGEKYVIARDYTTSSSSTSVTLANYNRVTSLTTGKSYVFVYGNSSTLANCTTLKALSENAVLSGSYYYKAAIDVTATSSNTVLNAPNECDYVYNSSSDYSGYYTLAAEHESSYPYLYATRNANTSGEYYYLATVGTAQNRYSCWTITSSNGRFLLRNYGIYYNDSASYYVAYDATNDRFTTSTSTTYAYLYAFEKSTTTATFTAPTTLSMTPGQTTSSPCFSVTASGTDYTQRVGAAISSSNENVVTVNDDGTLTAHMPGTSCVTVGIASNGTYYIKEITVKVFDTRSDPGTTALYALRDASNYGKLTVYYSSSSSTSSYAGMHQIAGTPVILYPGIADTNNVAFVAVDPILEDAVTWQYSSTGLMNMSTETYMTGFRYTTSSSSSTYNNTIRLADTSVTTSTTGTPYVSRAVTYGSSGTGSIGTGATLKIGNQYARYTAFDAETLLAGKTYTGSVLSGDNFRIFKLSTVTINPGVIDDAISGIDIFSIRDTDSDRQYISQTHAIYNDVNAGENFHLDYELIDMPTGYQIHDENCEWECREMSMIMVNGEAVPIITGFDEETGTFTVNPALSALDEWQGYVVVGYVYGFTYPGDENVHEVANYGKIYLSSADYEMAEEDLPEFPEPGFVGLDKTAATPYGAFINTGIGKVELTNFGIPASKPIDVVLILDISGSMNDNIIGASERKIRKAKEAAIEFANTLLTDSDNSLSIVTFSNGANVITGDMTPTQASFIREGSLNSAAYLINQVVATGGTNFDAALKNAYQIMYDNYQAYGKAHSRAIVFMTDGAPGFYNNIELNDKLTGTQTGNWSSTDQSYQRQAWDRWCLGSTSSYTSLNLNTYFTATEQYNYSANGTNMYLDAAKMTAGTVLTSSNFTNQTWVNALNALGGVGQAKGLGTTVYTVGFDIANSDYINAQAQIGLTGASAAKCMQNNATSASYYYNADAQTDLTDVFVEIAHQIRLVAKNAVTTDTISEYFDLNVDTGYAYLNSSDQTITGTATGSNVITYGYYELDDNYNVKLENGQPVYHEVEHVTVTGSNLDTNNYEATITGATSDLLTGSCWKPNAGAAGQIQAKWFTYDVATKEFTWNINEGNRMEDKKMYSLTYSVRLLDEYRVEGSTYYPTNAHAELNYDDVYDYHVELEYPIPELPWSGGHVRYEFYLVNEQGQPINTAGTVVPFSQRVIVYAGTDVKFHPTATTSDTKTFRADEIISDLGLAYELYDDDASYQVTINDDTYTSGSMTLVSNGATYVTGLPGHAQPYNVSGTENYTDGQCPVSTLVSFPVVFKLAINPDVIIIDYAIGVNADVIANDLLPGTTSTAPLYAVGTVEPATTVPNAYGIVATANLAAGFVTKGSANGLTVTNEAGYILGTAAVVSSGSKNVIRFTPTQYMISNPQVVDLYCAVQGNIPSAEGATVTTRQAYMYEKLTIVPANVMYYDDSYFTTTANFNNNGDQGAYLNGTGNANASCQWVVEGTTPDALQHTSRINDTTKDDVHGYDAALAEFSEHSFNTSHSVTVPVFSAGVTWPTMSFTFSGTGLEIVTDSKVSTGLMSVVITPVGSNSPVKKLMIDTYYSEVQGDEGLTQIPTCRVDLDNYGTYNVTISAIHNTFYGNLHGNYADAGIKSTVTIDAIRVFEPIASSNETVTGYYKLNNQAYPEIVNIQDAVINEVNFNAYNDVALYKLDGSTLTAAEAIESGASYAIFNTNAGKVLGVDTTGALTAYSATVSGTTLTVEGASNSSLYLWTIAESGIEVEDEIVRYTVKSNSSSKYLTVAGANSSAVEFGELTTVAAVSATEPEFGNQWTYDTASDRLMTGPMKQQLQGVFFRDLYYAIGYFTSFRAVSTVEPGSTETNNALNGLLMLDGGTTNDPEIYKTVGPTNEVYVMPGSTLTFKLTAAAEPAGVYLEMKSPYGTEIKASAYTANTVKPDAEVIRTATGMYYNITDRLVWHKGNAANGEDPRLWYSAAFLVFNETTSIDIQHVLSLSNIKFTYETATVSSDPFASKMSSTEYQRVINTVERDKWAVYSPLFDLDVHTAKVAVNSSNGTGISRFNEAYVTVVTSSDVGGLLVKDASGRLVTVKSCTYTDLDGVRTWKLTIDRTSAKSYNVYVTTVSSVFDMKNPVDYRVKVPAITAQLPFAGSGRSPLA